MKHLNGEWQMGPVNGGKYVIHWREIESVAQCACQFDRRVNEQLDGVAQSVLFKYKVVRVMGEIAVISDHLSVHTKNGLLYFHDVR